MISKNHSRLPWIAWGILFALFLAGAIQIQPAMTGSEIKIPILAYHDINPVAPTDYYVTPEQFAAQMDVLQVYGYTTVDFDNYLAFENGTAEPPEHPIIITFDDGFQGVYSYTLPILQERGMTGVFFIPTGFIGDTPDERQDNSWMAAGTPLSYHVIWPEVEALVAAGFQVGSHTVHHPNLNILTLQEMTYEIVQSYQTLQEHDPFAATFPFAYPFGEGNDNPDVRSLLISTGYEAAVDYGLDAEDIAVPGVSNIWALPRRSILRDVTLDLNIEDPWWFFMRRVDPQFQLPYIFVRDWQITDSAGNPRTHFYPGEQITATVTAVNGGSPVNVNGSIKLDGSLGTIYDSHAITPAEDILYTPFISGYVEQDFTYPLEIPAETASGAYTATFSARDETYLLGYQTAVTNTALVVEPLPIYVNTSTNLLNLTSIQPQQLVFTLTADLPGEQTYMTISLSNNLSIDNLEMPDGWTVNFYPPGSYVKARGCSSACLYSENPIYELGTSTFGTGNQVITATISVEYTSTELEWIAYRLTMRVPDGLPTPDWYLRDPLSGMVDQQDWYARFVPVLVARLFLPAVSR